MLKAYLIANDLGRCQRCNIASVGIDVAGIKQLWVSKSMNTTGLLVRADVVQFAEVPRELDVSLICQASLPAHNHPILVSGMS